METFKGAVYCLADIARSIELEDFKCYISILDYLIKCVNVLIYIIINRIHK